MASTSEAVLPAPTPEPAAPGFLAPKDEPFEDWVRPQQRTYATPSIRESGSLRPGPEWYPAWMKYRRREDNYIFWQEKFVRCSLEIPGDYDGKATSRWLAATQSMANIV